MICDDFVDYALKILDSESSRMDIMHWLLEMAFELGEDNQRMIDMEDKISATKAECKEPKSDSRDYMRELMKRERQRIEDAAEESKGK